MLPRLVEQMSAAVTCRLCSEFMDDAMGLPCGHTYCADCLLTATKDEYLCPECGVPFFVQDLNRVYALRETIEICRNLTQMIAHHEEDTEWELGALVMVSRNLAPGFNREGGLARVKAKVGTSYRVNYLMSRGNDIVAASDIAKYEASPCRTRRAARTESQKKIVVTGVVGKMSDDLCTGAYLNGVLQHRGLGATHIVCVGGTLKRSEKLLSAWATAEAVVRDVWLLESARCGKALPVEKYLVHDPDKERDWGISVAETLASRQLALHGYSVFASAPSLLRLPPNLNQIVESAGGSLIDVEPDYRITDRLVVIDDQAPHQAAHITLDVDQFLRAILRKKLPIAHVDTPAQNTESMPSQHLQETAMADDDDGSKTLLSLTPDAVRREAPNEESLPLSLDASFDPTTERTLDMHGLDVLFAWGDEMKEAYEARQKKSSELPRNDVVTSIASHGDDAQDQPAIVGHQEHGAAVSVFDAPPLAASPPHSVLEALPQRMSPPQKAHLVQRNITAYAPRTYQSIKRRLHSSIGSNESAKKRKRTSLSSNQSSHRLPLTKTSPGWLNVQRTMRSYFGSKAYSRQQDVVALTQVIPTMTGGHV